MNGNQLMVAGLGLGINMKNLLKLIPFYPETALAPSNPLQGPPQPPQLPGSPETYQLDPQVAADEEAARAIYGQQNQSTSSPEPSPYPVVNGRVVFPEETPSIKPVTPRSTPAPVSTEPKRLIIGNSGPLMPNIDRSKLTGKIPRSDTAMTDFDHQVQQDAKAKFTPIVPWELAQEAQTLWKTAQHNTWSGFPPGSAEDQASQAFFEKLDEPTKVIARIMKVPIEDLTAREIDLARAAAYIRQKARGENPQPFTPYTGGSFQELINDSRFILNVDSGIPVVGPGGTNLSVAMALPFDVMIGLSDYYHILNDPVKGKAYLDDPLYKELVYAAFAPAYRLEMNPIYMNEMYKDIQWIMEDPSRIPKEYRDAAFLRKAVGIDITKSPKWPVD